MSTKIAGLYPTAATAATAAAALIAALFGCGGASSDGAGASAPAEPVQRTTTQPVRCSAGGTSTTAAASGCTR